MMSRTGGLFGVLLLAALGTVHCCSHGWLKLGSHCYQISTEPLTHLSARRQCHLEGSELISIPDESVLRYISLQLNTVRGERFWVGITKDIEKDEFLWLDGNMVNQSWVRTQSVGAGQFYAPDSEMFQSYCFAYNGSVVFPEKCYERLGYICERNESVVSVSHNNCPGFGEQHSPIWHFVGPVTGHCIFLGDKDVEFLHAQSACQVKFHGELLSLEGMVRDDVLSFLRTTNFSDVQNYWTTLTWNGTNMLFPSGSVLKEDNISFKAGNGSCITLEFSGANILEVQLVQTECSAKAAAICSINPSLLTTTTEHTMAEMRLLNDGKCPQGYHWKNTTLNDFCYWETSFETDRITWDDAEKYCQSYGGHLVSLHSIAEERIGLSFQYGSLAHPYWIGLRYDPQIDGYKWTDGSPLDYQNWAEGHPDHMDKKLQCVAMEAREKHWISTMCGMLSWFVCKVPKAPNPVSPVLPTQPPLNMCDHRSYYFNGYCYFLKDTLKSWHEAKKYCDDEGASLVSIHNVDEVSFLLRLVYSTSFDASYRVWTGLNTFGLDDSLHWTDWSPVDFTFFGKRATTNLETQGRCYLMNIRNGFWTEENCNVQTGFICKRYNSTVSTTIPPSTPDPTVGSCRKGWIEHHDRCYLLGGVRPKDRITWTEAMLACGNHGGYLTSIRNERDQAFLSYILQLIKADTWIGLHDKIETGQYYWVDSTELRYTNWAPGEPSFFGIQEDCVMMKYDHIDSGIWKDSGCNKKMAYICMRGKERNVTEPSQNKVLQCLQPEGWLKLQNMCFKMYEGSDLTWHNAESACRKEGGYLASISNKEVKAVTSYLATEANKSFWIGLKYQESSQSFRWINKWPFDISNWEKNEPSRLKEGSCFVSTAEGYWKEMDCSEEMSFVCQITSGHIPDERHYVGECSDHVGNWIAGSSDYCYLMDSDKVRNWLDASLLCLFNYATHLVSIHSMKEMEDLKKIVKPGITSIFIGLYTNKKGGFMWTDDSPVNFVNWDAFQPEFNGEACVEMMMDTLKWRVTPCSNRRHFVCQSTKDTEVEVENIHTRKEALSADSDGLSKSGVVAISVCSLLGIIAIVAILLYLRTRQGRFSHIRGRFSHQNVSFENALYNADRANTELQDDGKNESL